MFISELSIVLEEFTFHFTFTPIKKEVAPKLGNLF